MKKLNISRATASWLASLAPGRLVGQRELPDGRFEIEVDDEVMRELDMLRFEGESDDIALQRAMAGATRRVQ